MSDGHSLSFKEFIADLGGVVTSPGHRFAAIHERGALWGSLLLMMVPVYLALSYLGGFYFDHDPFPGYSFIPPLIGAAVLTWIKLFGIHFVARLFEGKWRYRAATGKMRDLAVVFGYTGLPSIIALVLAIVLFLSLPDQIAGLFRNFRVATTSVLVALGLALFIWNLILMVLALRNVYPIRDYKLVISVLLGPILAGIPVLATEVVCAPVHFEFQQVAPILNPKVTRFVMGDPESREPGKGKMAVHVDFLVYRIKDPGRFDVVSFSPKPAEGRQDTGRKKRTSFFWTVGTEHLFIYRMHNQIIGRIVGLPGDEVELVQGRLRINGRFWHESYLPEDCLCDATVPPAKLGPSEYLILPEDRHQIAANRDKLIVDRDRIYGRLTLSKWPLGWLLLRPTVFLKAVPEN